MTVAQDRTNLSGVVDNGHEPRLRSAAGTEQGALTVRIADTLWPTTRS
jgi:hypothetical protein